MPRIPDTSATGAADAARVYSTLPAGPFHFGSGIAAVRAASLSPYGISLRSVTDVGQMRALDFATSHFPVT